MLYIIGVYLTLNGNVIQNDGYVDFNDIGSTDETALLCHTNRPPPPGSTNSGGDWFATEGTPLDGTDVPGFTGNNGAMVVRLMRATGTPAEGIYKCSIEDNTSVINTIYVGLYGSETGESVCSCQALKSCRV